MLANNCELGGLQEAGETSNFDTNVLTSNPRSESNAYALGGQEAK